MVIMLLATMMAAPQLSPEGGEGGVLRQALSCQVGQDQIGRLMTEIKHELGSGISLRQSYAVPSGDLFHLDKPVTVLGYASQEVYVQPGRVAILVDAPLSTVSAVLRLEDDQFGPANRHVEEGRNIVAWQLHQEGLAGRTLVGCEYQDPAAVGWLDQIEGMVEGSSKWGG